MSSDDLNAIRDFYDNRYYGQHAHGAHPAWHTRKIAERLGDPAGWQVLDVACGTGDWLNLFRKRGAGVAGIDLSLKAIEICRRELPEGEFVCGPAETLPFADARFDLVTCMGSLEHFVDKPAALAQMRRVAKADARFLILVPNAGFLTRRLGLYGGTQQVSAKEDVYELAEWNQLFEEAGLRVIARWRDLHPLSWSWIARGSILGWPVRAAQALMLAAWPLGWQYQVYHYCRAHDAA